MRAGFAALMATKIVPHKIRTTEVTLGGRRALLVEPTERERPGTILYFHGGSLVFGSPETALSLTGNLVVRTGLRALSLDYRLAPEHPFPVAIVDAPGRPCARSRSRRHPRRHRRGPTRLPGVSPGCWRKPTRRSTARLSSSPSIFRVGPSRRSPFTCHSREFSRQMSIPTRLRAAGAPCRTALGCSHDTGATLLVGIYATNETTSARATR